MGLKREHRETLELIRKQHDEELFKIRGEQALPVQYHVEKIQQVLKTLFLRFKPVVKYLEEHKPVFE
jgi:hypothetical protein